MPWSGWHGLIVVALGITGGSTASEQHWPDRSPALFGALIGTGSRTALLWFYVGGAVLMVGTAAVEAAIGVKAEGRSLESITKPLSAS